MVLENAQLTAQAPIAQAIRRRFDCDDPVCLDPTSNYSNRKARNPTKKVPFSHFSTSFDFGLTDWALRGS